MSELYKTQEELIDIINGLLKSINMTKVKQLVYKYNYKIKIPTGFDSNDNAISLKTTEQLMEIKFPEISKALLEAFNINTKVVQDVPDEYKDLTEQKCVEMLKVLLVDVHISKGDFETYIIENSKDPNVTAIDVEKGRLLDIFYNFIDMYSKQFE